MTGSDTISPLPWATFHTRRDPSIMFAVMCPATRRVYFARSVDSEHMELLVSSKLTYELACDFGVSDDYALDPSRDPIKLAVAPPCYDCEIESFERLAERVIHQIHRVDTCDGYGRTTSLG